MNTRRKRPFFVFGISFLLATVLMLAATNAAPPPITITISASSTTNSASSTTTFKSGENILLSLFYTNITNSDVPFNVEGSGGGPEYHNLITVLGPDGKPAPRTQVGRYIYRDEESPLGSARNAIQTTLGPGTPFKETSVISAIYDMTVPGRYTIYVERNISTMQNLLADNSIDRTKDIIKSNVITVQVIP